jgi:hypothetical protein
MGCGWGVPIGLWFGDRFVMDSLGLRGDVGWREAIVLVGIFSFYISIQDLQGLQTKVFVGCNPMLTSGYRTRTHQGLLISSRDSLVNLSKLMWWFRSLMSK